MKLFISIVILIAFAYAKDQGISQRNSEHSKEFNRGHTNSLVNQSERKLPSFREALYNATHSHTQDIHEPSKQPHKIFFEVIRINERLMVDQKNNTKGYNANLYTTVYTIESGHLRRLFVRELKIIPKPGSPLLKAIQAKHFLKEGPILIKSDPKKGLKGFFDKIYKDLHLNETFPAMIAAIILGFLTTAVIYLIAYAVLFIYYKATGYSPLDVTDEDLKDSSEDQLLKDEQKRMEESKPLVSKA